VRRGGIAILDTGPIWELVLYNAVKQLGFASLEEDLAYFVNPQAYENCGIFLSTFARKTTSASVVAELYHRIRPTEAKGHPKLWELVYEEFKNMRMDEDVVRLLDMEPNLVAKYGPTDVSLLEIARRNLGRGPVILTVDARFHMECKKTGTRSELLIEVCNPE